MVVVIVALGMLMVVAIGMFRSCQPFSYGHERFRLRRSCYCGSFTLCASALLLRR